MALLGFRVGEICSGDVLRSHADETAQLDPTCESNNTDREMHRGARSWRVAAGRGGRRRPAGAGSGVRLSRRATGRGTARAPRVRSGQARPVATVALWLVRLIAFI